MPEWEASGSSWGGGKGRWAGHSKGKGRNFWGYGKGKGHGWWSDGTWGPAKGDGRAIQRAGYHGNGPQDTSWTASTWTRPNIWYRKQQRRAAKAAAAQSKEEESNTNEKNKMNKDEEDTPKEK